MDESLILLGVLVAFAVYLVLIGCAHLLRRIRGLRFRWPYHLFAVAVSLLVGVHRLPGDWAWRTTAVMHLTAASVVFAAFPLVTLINRVCWVRFDAAGRRIEAPRVLIDLTGVVVAALAVVATLQFIYGMAVPGLLAGSGVVALVLGLGMQDQLKNLFAGLALHFEKPFKTGDWLLIDGVHARVIEISWRSTRLLTTDEVQIEVDNSTLLNQTIYNFELPTPEHALRVTIGLHYDAPPARAMEVLRNAAASVPGVAKERPPVVFLKDFGDSAITYEIKLWTCDHGQMSRILSDVRAHCWYAVKRAGLEIPYPQMVLHRAVGADYGAGARQVAAETLQRHQIFSCLNGEQCAAVVEASSVVRYAKDEHLIEQGAEGSSMFILVHGSVVVRVAKDGLAHDVATLGAGACVGEMSLLTGDQRSATVVAETEVEAVEIGKASFGSFVRANPSVLDHLSALLAQRQLHNEKRAAELAAPVVEELKQGALRRLRAFFALV